MTRLLFIGDIVGRPGRELVRRGLAALVAHHHIDLVIANVENAAAGFGVTPDIADDLLAYGVHVMTGGNHTWDKKEIVPYFADQPRLFGRRTSRPARLGRGVYVARATNGVPVAVINAMGRVFMTAIDDPFRVVARRDRGGPPRSARSCSSISTPKRRRRRSRWAGTSTAARRSMVGHAHARADGRRARPAAGHRLHHRRRHDGAARLGDRRRALGHPPALPDRPAAAVRDCDRESPAECRASSRPTRTDGPRALDRARSSLSAAADRGARGAAVRRSADAWRLAAGCRSRSGTGRRPLSVSELTARLKQVVEGDLRPRHRRGRDLELQAVELRPHLLHSEG